MKAVDGQPFGVGSMVDPLRRVLVGEPAGELAAADPALWHYEGPVDLDLAKRQHADFVAILESLGVAVERSEDSGGSCDAMFVHDPVLVSSAGSVGLRPGKMLRRPEVNAGLKALDDAGVPRVGVISAGVCEGGDLLWLDRKTLLAGVGYRTDQEGIAELQRLLGPSEVTIEAFDLPVFQGADACLHLQSLVSMLDHDLALVHSPLMPVRLLQRLKESGVEVLEAPAEEFATQATNVLCVRPRVLITLDVNVATRELMERHGCEVHAYEGSEISLKTEGGATCLTRPILRTA